jgi:hypothetical protein
MLKVYCSNRQSTHLNVPSTRPHPLPLSRERERGEDGGALLWHA